MSKSITSELKTFLLSSDLESCYIADCFDIVLPSGQELLATNFQIPITWSGKTYSPTAYGSWTFDSISTELGVCKSKESFSIAADSTITLAPFNVPLIECIQLGMFDGASFKHIRLFISSVPGYNPSTSTFSSSFNIVGQEIKFSGQISEISAVGRTSAKGTVENNAFKLNQPFPRHVLQPGCRWEFGSAPCGISLSSFTYTSTVSSLSGKTLTLASAISVSSSATIAQGYAKFTSGQNTGLSVGIESQTSSTVIVLDRPPLLPIASGDGITIVAGCDHTTAQCASYNSSNWRERFGGQPFIPNSELSVVA